MKKLISPIYERMIEIRLSEPNGYFLNCLIENYLISEDRVLIHFTNGLSFKIKLILSKRVKFLIELSCLLPILTFYFEVDKEFIRVLNSDNYSKVDRLKWHIISAKKKQLAFNYYNIINPIVYVFSPEELNNMICLMERLREMKIVDKFDIITEDIKP